MEDTIGYNLYSTLSEVKLSNILLRVDVKESRLIELENDFGKIKSSKPFYPFTTRPIKNSNFYINHEEVFSKDWEEINIRFDWKNTPDDFKSWYRSYLTKTPGKYCKK